MRSSDRLLISRQHKKRERRGILLVSPSPYHPIRFSPPCSSAPLLPCPLFHLKGQGCRVREPVTFTLEFLRGRDLMVYAYHPGAPMHKPYLRLSLAIGRSGTGKIFTSGKTDICGKYLTVSQGLTFEQHLNRQKMPTTTLQFSWVLQRDYLQPVPQGL